jgi:hypothetical protein
MRMTLLFSIEGEWWPSVRAALEAYRKTPHTSTGESPLFLFMGQEPLYSIDHLLPLKPKSVYNQEENTLDLAQLRTAYALARKNTCLARRQSKPVKESDHTFRAGDRVYRKNFKRDRGKLDPTWLTGYRIVRMESSRKAIIEDSRTKIKATVGTKHLKWADPISELLDNSDIDVFPGNSRLYFHSTDLNDLNWPAIVDAPPMSDETTSKMNEVVRNRENDATPQVTPPKATNASTTANQAVSNDSPAPREGTSLRRSSRQRQPSRKVKEAMRILFTRDFTLSQ